MPNPETNHHPADNPQGGAIPIPPLPPEGDTFDRPTVEKYGQTCMLSGIMNERYAAHYELDRLAREFDAAGRSNTAARIRAVMAAIEGRT